MDTAAAVTYAAVCIRIFADRAALEREYTAVDRNAAAVVLSHIAAGDLAAEPGTVVNDQICAAAYGYNAVTS